MTEPTIETDADIAAAIARISFENTALDFKWRFEFRTLSANPDRDGVAEDRGWLLWVTFERPDAVTGEVGRGRGREEVVWRGASLSSVVKTCWLLVELMVRHELMEGFRLDGRRIFNPHNSVLDLLALQKDHDKRNKLDRILEEGGA